MRWVVRLVAVLVAGLAAGSARSAEPYDIHVILELTGGGAFIGNSEKVGAQLAELAVNRAGGIDGRMLHFIFHDNQSTPQVAVQLANDVLGTHPVVVLASTLNADCAAMAPLFANGPVLYCYTPSFHPKAGTYIYSQGVSTRDLAIAGMRNFRLRGWKRIALITSTDATGQDAEKNLLEIAKFPENKDVAIVENAKFNTNDVTVSAQIERMKAANPQAIIAWTTGTPVATVFRGLQQAGLDIPVATTAGNEIRSQMEQFAAFLPSKLFFFTAPWPAMGDPRLKMDPEIVQAEKQFEQIFKEKGVEPDQGSDSGWEPVLVLNHAFHKLGINATATQLQNWLQHAKGFAGVSGVYDFDRTPQRGLNVDNALVTIWDPKNQRFVPASRLGGGLIEK